MGNITLLPLETDDQWSGFTKMVDPGDRHAAVSSIFSRLRLAGAQSAILEDQYLDRDYSQEFAAFYSRQFRRYRRRARRAHFFCMTAPELSAHTNQMAKFVATLTAASDARRYLGFIVIRPVEEAPIGRSVLRLPRQVQGITETVQIRTDHTAHLLGAPLSVRGLPFMQQDARLSACAQASIWMCGRHFNVRHGGPWYSTADITEAASKPTDMSLAQSLPAGAGFLSADNMLRALTAMGRQPYLYARVPDPKTSQLVWPTQLSPQAILARYADSGIPSILILGPWIQTTRIGHAVVVSGTTFAAHVQPPQLTVRPTAAEFCPYFLVHDDQRGPYLRLPVRKTNPLGETPYNIDEHLIGIIVPLPDRVFITAEAAERVAWDFLEVYSAGWSTHKVQQGSALGASARLGDDLVSSLQANLVIARTYLTFGWKYKSRLVANTVPDVVKTVVSEHELPRLVWVTEFSRFTDMNLDDAQRRRIVAHCVVDATSSQISSCRLVFHAPGYLSLWAQDAPDFFPQIPQTIYAISDDQPYLPRVRHDG